MRVNHTIPKRPLRPFKSFVPERYRSKPQERPLGRVMTEETFEMTITQASAIVIDSTSTDEERAKAINDFAEDIANMSGERIVAIAVVSD